MSQPQILFSAAAGNTAAVFAQVKGELTNVGAAVSQARALMLSLGAALGVGSFGAATKGASEAADAAAKMGDRFGIATEKMIGMNVAGELGGASRENVALGLKNIASQAVSAARGEEEAGRAFRALNINASEFVKLPMDRQFSIVIDRLGSVENVTLRNELANKMLGKSYGELMGLVADGSESFKAATADAEAWGLAINRVDAAKLEMANDAIKRSEMATKGLFTQVAIHLAPAVKALADLFAGASGEATNFKDIGKQAADAVKEAIGKAADMVQMLRFAWMQAKLAVAEFATFTLEGISKVIGIIPNKWAEGVKLMAESTATVAGDIKAEIQALVLEGLPSERIAEVIAKYEKTMDEAAKRIAKRRQDMMRGSPEDIPQDKGTDAFTAGLVRQLEQIAEANALELDLLRNKFERRQEILDISLERGYITQEFWEGQSALLFAKYEDDKTKILDEETKKRYGISQVYRQLDLASAGYFFGQLAGMMQSKNRAMWEVGKAAAISETIIQTYRAAQGAYAALASIPYVGPVLGAAAAAAAIVAGIARVQQIRSTSFGSTSASPVYNANPNTGVPTAPIGSPIGQTAPTGGQNVTYVINVYPSGVVVGSNAMEELAVEHIAPAIKAAMRDKDLTLFDRTSRQALNLVPAR